MQTSLGSRWAAPAYDDVTYWEARFARVAAREVQSPDRGTSNTVKSSGSQRAVASSAAQDAVEWLGNGTKLLQPVEALIQAQREARRLSSDSLCILHLGAGVSDLSLRLGELFLSHGMRLDGIINLDFSHSALIIGRARERQWRNEAGFSDRDSSDSMQFCQADLRDWQSVKESLSFLYKDANTPSQQIDGVLDKSTCDSLATAERLSLTGLPDPERNCCHLLHRDGTAQGLASSDMLTVAAAESDISALELVALHMAALVKSGGFWSALTYASDRFAFLADDDEDNNKMIECPSLARKYWTIEEHESTPAASGSDSASAPPIYHHRFLLRRR